MDIGELTGPVLLFGGPYSNLQALIALRQQASARGIRPGNVICTGDVVAYCGDPAETVAAVREWGVHVVAGNCEEQLAAGAADCGCGFEEGSTCDALSGEWYAFAAARIDADARHWMGGLPRRLIFRHEGRRWAVIHGGATAISRMIWPTDPWAVKAAEIESLEAEIGPVDGVICGHSGFAFVQQGDGRTWVNAGVIGMPRHGGGQTTEFAILSDGPTIHALDYDAATAAAAMGARRSPYAASLLSGWWPSEDMLPPPMRRAALSSAPAAI